MNRPTDVLEKTAAAAWQAYNAMQATKQRHLEFLTLLENRKKKFNLDASAEDEARLACLLADHDQQVKSFSAASQALKADYPQAHKALFEYIGMLHVDDNDALTAH